MSTYKASGWGLAILLAFSAANLAWAQVVGGSVSGTITDETGGPIPGVQIVVRDVETGAERRLNSDEAGRYSTPSVPVGHYEISASKDSFRSQTKTGIELVVAERTIVDFTLQVGDVK